MKPRWFVLLLLTMMWAAGCTRDAGVEPFEPVPTSADAANSTSIPAATPTDVEAIDADAQAAATDDVEPPTDAPAEATEDEPASPTPAETDLPIITITDTPTPTETDLPPTNTVPPSPTTRPTSTPADDDTADALSEGDGDAMVDASDADAMEEGDDDITSTPAPGFTPISPGSDIVNPPTSTPRPTSTPVVTEGADDEDPLITPTQDGELAGVPLAEDGCTYTVSAGDNAYRIAVNNNITLTELRNANDLVGEAPILQIGQVLEIPGCGQGTDVNTIQSTADDDDEDSETITPDGLTPYTVTAGDTLLAIARRFDTTINDIVEANNLANPDSLSIGQELLIPEGSASE